MKIDREFRQLREDAYQLSVKALGISLTVDRLHRERHDLHGELSVACTLAGAHPVNGYLSVASFNLSSAPGRSQRAKLLSERSEAPDVDWHGLIEELCVQVITAERSGSPARLLHTFPSALPTDHSTWNISGWPWLQHHPMITFADGGSLKSYLALYGLGLLATRGVTVGLVDWELTGEDHAERLRRLFGDEPPPIHYLRCDKPLINETDRLIREVRRLSIDYLVFDSAGFGTAGPPEGAEEALAYFRAVRQIGCGSHHLAHVNRSEGGDQKPFGSVFWHNSARSTWFAKQTTSSSDGHTVVVGLYNRKPYDGVKPATGFQFDFDDHTTSVTPINVADVSELASGLPLWQRIKNAVRAKPLTLVAIADELDTTVKIVDTTVRRKPLLFARVSGPDGIDRIALMERRSS